METMRAEIAAHPPVEGSYSARRGDYCLAKFADGEWYVCTPVLKSFTTDLNLNVVKFLTLNSDKNLMVI